MPSIQGSKPNNLVQTIERTSLILDILGQSAQGISIRDLSAKINPSTIPGLKPGVCSGLILSGALNPVLKAGVWRRRSIKLPKGTTHRLLSSLSYFGYVRQDSRTRNYFLGLKLVELGNLLLSQLDLRKEAEPLLRDLAERTKETVHMVFLDRGEIVYIDKVELDHNPSGLRMASRVGLRNPAHSSAVGKVLLSHLSEEELNHLTKEKGLPKRTENTITDLIQLKEHLKAVRTHGYAIDDEENEKGIRCIAAPIYNEVGKAVVAISISGPAFQITKKVIQESLKKEVIETALRISQKLGFQERR